ncbi:Hypothetical predicted protein [Xyrichtys novacula]|uniref:Uncharacterized protein n=1 Tax=Xyrichtys novacula TaxID=13765 RepID=A0AAV1FG15_XYRNO|nr:Hypothetical predicted protein [Xyrichtys novacula]
MEVAERYKDGQMRERWTTEWQRVPSMWKKGLATVTVIYRSRTTSLYLSLRICQSVPLFPSPENRPRLLDKETPKQGGSRKTKVFVRYVVDEESHSLEEAEESPVLPESTLNFLANLLRVPTAMEEEMRA